MKVQFILLIMLPMFNTFAGDKCYGDDGLAVCHCQKQENSIRDSNVFELNREESDDFIKKCLTFKYLAEIVLEYETRIKEKYGDAAKVKIYMTAAAAMTPIAKDELAEYSVSRLHPWIFIRSFSMHGCKVVRQGDAFIIDVKEPEPEKRPVTAEKIDNTTYVSKDELPKDIFVIEEDCITQSYSVIVIDGKQFKSVETVLGYINKLPADRLKNGILFRFDSKVEYKLSEALVGKVIELAKNKNIPFYSWRPRGMAVKDGKVFRKHTF